LWWSNPHFPNFGDMLTPIIIEKLFHQKCEWANLNECELIGIGSIIEKTLEGIEGNDILVWGSGFIAQPKTKILWGDEVLKYDIHDLDRLTFCSVRGKHTLERLDAKWQDIPLGDPALLINLVIPPAKNKNHKIGIVPHYSDYNDKRLDAIKKDGRYLIINPLDPAEKVCRSISACKVVFSSSLHGLIVADSYGVPNIHMPMGDLLGKKYKFIDYYSGIGKKYKTFNISGIGNDSLIQAVIAKHEPIREIKQLQKHLMHAYPFTLLNRMKRKINKS
jgi:hypothetical protein